MSWRWDVPFTFVILSSLITSVPCLPVTFRLEPKQERCFYQQSEKQTTYKVEVFVPYGGAHDLQLRVAIFPPKPPSSKPELKVNERISKVTSSHEFEVPEGECEICVINGRRYNQDAKHVMLTIDEKHPGDGSSSVASRSKTVSSTEKDANDGMEAIRASVTRLGEVLSEINQKQHEEMKSIVERNTAAEDNDWSMMNSSILETIVLLAVSLGQIFFVRHWFQGKGTLLKQWM